METATAAKPMNKSERTEVRRIVKGRFELLRDQLAARAREVRSVIRQGVRKEYREPMAEAQKRSAALSRRLRSVVEDTIKLHQEMAAKGIKAEYSLLESRKEMGSEVERIIGYYLEGWDPAKLEEMVNQRETQLKKEHGCADLNLRNQEMSILEELAVDGISKEAHAFLERVPVVDDFLPLPEGETLKALAAGE